MYDIVIVGAGPAGATLARLLGKKLKILIMDKRQLLDMNSKSNFEKCCGGLLAPDAQQMLAKFGLGIPKDILVGPQLFTVRTIDIQNNIEQYYQRHYINVHREKFDKWLVSMVPPEVTVVCEAVFKRFEIANDNNIKVQYFEQGKERTIYTKVLVGADGAFSTVRRKISLDSRNPKTYISIQEYYKMNSNLPYFSSIFDDDITDFYSWTIPKDDLLVLGTAVMPKNKPYEKFMALKKKLILRGFEFGPCVKKNGAYLLRPEKLDQICLGKANIPLIGEAAGWISPSSAEGLSYSFKSAYALANAIQKRPDSIIAEYYRNTNKLRINIRLKHLKSPFMYNTFLRKIAMKSGLMSMDIIN
ncbi:protein CbrA [Clostridium pasteurianum DSM 525 = ATCC 6013]|uniref:Protein CbrA n=1 Tax=Clostridium pasteurianum DSM 525 = ATCC 6013 TaxID=1262449 RepID=A0A0H3JAR6_CLOPA|nr:FAD-binding protein [Clostridium pasteurianum]AJA48795.1 protein CbrA [Clostridium pasteurianum DSM 525 = ATCC 6013]AJA52783.1 protein CbrA [Clostridium pasteurianum DSM 525 = ATCC 6013]AOZ76015.1 oxidoreductase [Clostridium pasteurianum DSM 525 = ATCC 6013]AOZ79811.1 oxidoreductase [Clostridium pasteurianum]ELP60092.1 oxidoreductase [Clostridium pasteurianum DSM 525 = ATCC 6013]